MQLVAVRCADLEVERVLLEREAGPFIPLDSDWRQQVMWQIRRKRDAQETLDAVLMDRMEGPFVEFAPDEARMDRICPAAAKLCD